MPEENIISFMEHRKKKADDAFNDFMKERKELMKLNEKLPMKKPFGEIQKPAVKMEAPPAVQEIKPSVPEIGLKRLEVMPQKKNKKFLI